MPPDPILPNRSRLSDEEIHVAEAARQEPIEHEEIQRSLTPQGSRSIHPIQVAEDEPSQQFTLRADAYHSFAAQPVQIDNLSQQVMTVNRQVGLTGSMNQPNAFKDD